MGETDDTSCDGAVAGKVGRWQRMELEAGELGEICDGALSETCEGMEIALPSGHLECMR